jgi:hypothetical protein
MTSDDHSQPGEDRGDTEPLLPATEHQRPPADDWFDETTSVANGGGAAAVEGEAPGNAPPSPPHSSARGGSGDRRRLAAGRVLVALVVCFGVASLLDSRHLERTAKELPFGTKRTVLVALAKPLRVFSAALFLDVPGRLLDEALGRAGGAGRPELKGIAHRVHRRTSSSRGTLPPSRVFTREDPLVLYIGGDSMVGILGQSLVRISEASKLVDARLDYHIATGLCRPDFFDWPLRLRAEMRGLAPDAVVLEWGGNDLQAMQVGDHYVVFPTPAWEKEYRRRIDQVLAIVRRPGRHIYWLGQPVMRSPEMSRKLAILNGIYRSETAGSPDVTYVDIWSVLTDAHGDFSAYLADARGLMELVRESDGEHLTAAGGDRVAWVVWPMIKKDFRLGRKAPAGSTLPEHTPKPSPSKKPKPSPSAASRL